MQKKGKKKTLVCKAKMRTSKNCYVRAATSKQTPAVHFEEQAIKQLKKPGGEDKNRGGTHLF